MIAVMMQSLSKPKKGAPPSVYRIYGGDMTRLNCNCPASKWYSGQCKHVTLLQEQALLGLQMGSDVVVAERTYHPDLLTELGWLAAECDQLPDVLIPF